MAEAGEEGEDRPRAERGYIVSGEVYPLFPAAVRDGSGKGWGEEVPVSGLLGFSAGTQWEKIKY